MTLAEALAETHRNNCLPDRHDDACIALTAGFDELVEQRDLARRVAVDLEAELAAREAALSLIAVEA